MIAVGSGFNTKNSRSKESTKLLTYGLTNFDTIKITNKDINFANLDVWHGTKNEVGAYVKENIYKTIPKARKKFLKVTINYSGPIVAPINKDQQVGIVKIFYKDELIDQYDLYASENIKRLNVFSRLIKSINYLIWGDV